MSPGGKKAGPSEVGVRMYQVGFGDCFLLSFYYDEKLDDDRDQRHVLIDFGSSHWPKGHKGRYIDITRDIATHTGGRLDAIVATHRHKDHISGFANEEATDVLAGLKPSLVVQPWTENPDDKGEGSQRFAASLETAQAFADELANGIPTAARGFRGDVRDLAAHQLANEAAVNRLAALADDADLKGEYLSAGDSTKLDKLLPGVDVTVLGPPTIEQWPQVQGQRANDPEYWIARRGLLEQALADDGAPAGVQAAAAAAEQQPVDPGPVRWLVESLRGQHSHSLLRIVHALDDALNNSSVILMFETGERRLVFPGDAQIENWSFSLGIGGTEEHPAELHEGLDDVDFYKVGHHGSRNASPRSLLKLWEPRKGKVTSMMSTMKGVHGETVATAVPRETLTDELERLGRLYRTDEAAELPVEAVCLEARGSTKDREPFKRTAPP